MMSGDDTAVIALIKRLDLAGSGGFQEEELLAIEKAAATSLAEPVRYFLTNAGNQRQSLFLSAGPEAGRAVVFLGAPEIIEYLVEDMGGSQLIPFATCLMGDLFCIRGEAEDQNVVLADLAAERLIPIADTFLDFLNMLSLELDENQ
jgi:hypothetical protein